MEIKIGTWNIGSLSENYSANLDTIHMVISKFQPDILFFQEYYDNPLVDKVCFDATKIERVFFKEFSSSHVAPQNVGLAVFSKYEFVLQSIYKLVKPDKEFLYKNRTERFHDKSFIHLKACINNIPLNFVTGHGFPFYRYNQKCEDYPEVFGPLDDWIFSIVSNYQNTIVLGDFNIEEGSRVLNKLERGYSDVFYGEPSRPTGRKTDYVYLKNNIVYKDKINFKIEDLGDERYFDHHYLQITVVL